MLSACSEIQGKFNFIEQTVNIESSAWTALPSDSSHGAKRFFFFVELLLVKLDVDFVSGSLETLIVVCLDTLRFDVDNVTCQIHSNRNGIVN